MRGLVVLPLSALLLLGPLGLVACQRETTPPLIQVLDVSPREVEEGDHLAVAGVGFPEGKTAHVAFRGDLLRPGAAPVRGVEVDVDAVVASGTEIDIPFDANLQRLFAGAGDRAAHTTFSGELTVAFAASRPAAPPVAGTLRDTWLDVRPPTPHRAVAEAEVAEGERTLAFLGIRAQSSQLAAGGVLVDSVDPGSRAEAARLLAGDVITEFDGVRVLSARDLVSEPGARGAWLKIRRGGSPHEEVAKLSLSGLEPRPATALLGPVLILGLAAVLHLLFFAPTPAFVAWLERTTSRRLQALDGGGASPRGRIARGLVRRFGASRSGRLVFGGTSAVLVLPAFARFLGIGDVDVGILCVVATTSLATLGLITGGLRTAGRYSLLAGLGTAARVISLGIPAAAAVVGAVMTTGSLRVEDIVGAQGGWPWGWTVFRSPPALGLVVLWLLTALARGSVDRSGWPELRRSVDAAGAARQSALSRLFAVAGWAQIVVMCAVAAALFFGGWQVPGLAPEQVEGHLGWTSLGAALFVAKTWLLVFTLGVARRALPPVHADRTMSVCWRWLVPLSLMHLLLAVAWVARRPGPSAETLVGAVTLAVTSAVMLHVIVRVRGWRGAPESDLDPFV
jgi:NADH-quinone oxidoreductase subunit H